MSWNPLKWTTNFIQKFNKEFLQIYLRVPVGIDQRILEITQNDITDKTYRYMIRFLDLVHKLRDAIFNRF